MFQGVSLIIIMLIANSTSMYDKKKKKILQKMGIEGAYCNIIKIIYINPQQTLFSTVKN